MCLFYAWVRVGSVTCFLNISLLVCVWAVIVVATCLFFTLRGLHVQALCIVLYAFVCICMRDL